MRDFMQMQPMQMQPMQVEDDPRMRDLTAALTGQGIKMMQRKPKSNPNLLTSDTTINPSIMMRPKLSLLDAL